MTTAAPIFLLPDASSVPLRTAASHTRLRVLEEAPEGWIKVEFHDPQFGHRIGFIESKYVRIHRPGLEPMDLSIGEGAAGAGRASIRAHRRSRATRCRSLSRRRAGSRGGGSM